MTERFLAGRPALRVEGEQRREEALEPLVVGQRAQQVGQRRAGARLQKVGARRQSDVVSLHLAWGAQRPLGQAGSDSA